jgi:glutamate-1-semialdehyde 2,1-aminomutase
MQYPDERSASAQLFSRACKVLPGGISRSTIALSPYPIYVRKGEGAYVQDEDGQQLLDLNNNYTSLIHGHARREIVDAVAAQVSEGTGFSFATRAEIELAELLVGRVEAFDQIRFTNSGTEAVMNMVKAARAFTKRSKIAKCEGAYHGSYDYVEVSMDSRPETWGNGWPASIAYAAGSPQHVSDDVVVIPFNDLEATREILKVNRGQLAGILIDPIPNRIGLVEITRDYLALLLEFCAEDDALLLFDEVISFRRDHAGTQGRLGVKPDLTALGKIIGGGFPVGAVAGRADVMAVFDGRNGKAALPHGGTFNANPVTMTAGRVAMALMTPDAFDRLNHLGEVFGAAFGEAIGQAGLSASMAIAGSLFRIHMKPVVPRNYREGYPSPMESQALEALHIALMRRGVFISPYGLACVSTATSEADLGQVSSSVYEAASEVVARFPKLSSRSA